MSPRVLAAIVVLGVAALACQTPTPTSTPVATATLGPPTPALLTSTPAPVLVPTYPPATIPTAPPLAATATPAVGLLLAPPYIPPPGAVKLELVIHPVDFKGRWVLGPAGESYLFVPIVVVEPRALNQGLTMISNPMSSETNGGIFYFKRDTVVTLSAQDNQCWFFANWDTAAPFEVIPRLPTIMDLYKTRIQLRLDRDVKIVAYFGKTADYDRTDLKPRCDGS